MLLRIPRLDAALEFYRDRLGLDLVWIREGMSAGLRMKDSDTELVLAQEEGPPETDLLVESADTACQAFVAAGGTVVTGPIDIPIGRYALVRDPWGNELSILDMTKGPLKVDSAGRVMG